MYARLGFAVAIHVDPDVLLIDEVLAVGDEAFTRKCLDKIGEFRRRGKTIVLVTHSLGLVEKMCDDVLWLRQGTPRGPGRPQARGRRLPDLRRGRRGGAARAGARQGAGGRAGRGARRTRRRAGHGYREGRWGSREVEITERPPARRPRPPAARLHARREPDGGPLRARREAGRGLRLRHRAVHDRRRQRVRHEHAPRGVRGRDPARQRRGPSRARRTCVSSRARISSTWPRTGATGRRTTTTAGCTRSGSRAASRTSASIGRRTVDLRGRRAPPGLAAAARDRPARRGMTARGRYPEEDGARPVPAVSPSTTSPAPVSASARPARGWP